VRAWLGKLVFALPLVLSTGVMVLWVRSYWALDAVSHNHGQWALAVDSTEGTLLFIYDAHAIEEDPRWLYVCSVPVEECGEMAMGFHWGTARYIQLSGNGTRSGYQRQVSFPHWAAMSALLLFYIPAVKRVMGRRRERVRARKGLCPECGYDLRASKDRCPECGSPIPPEKQAG